MSKLMCFRCLTKNKLSKNAIKIVTTKQECRLPGLFNGSAILAISGTDVYTRRKGQGNRNSTTPSLEIVMCKSS